MKIVRKKRVIEPWQISRYILWGAVILAFLILNYWYLDKYLSFNPSYITDYQAQEDVLSQYRNPAVAGIFYAGTERELSQSVDQYLEAGKFRNHLDYQSKIIIVPHAGYAYSAGTAAKAYFPLKNYASTIKNVIVLGPSHYYGGTNAYLSDANYFKTPLGNVKVNKQIVHQLAESNKKFSINNKAHEKEHSLEVQLPFIQKVLPKAKIIPIVYGNIEPEEIATSLEKYLKQADTILVVSADLSHYHSYEMAQQLDKETADKIERKQPLENHDSCGATGINAALLLSENLNYYPQMIELINSGDTGSDKGHVVGYGAWEFYPDTTETEKKDRLGQEVKNLQDYVALYGKNLQRIAYISLEKAVRNHKKYSPSRRSYPEEIFDKGASFVTLYKKGELRGCIGSVLPSMSIAQDIADNTYAAALEDKRFSPITAKELPNITYTISLLTGFEEIIYHNEQDLIKKINRDIDGIVIRDGNRQGVFLPDVWKIFPNKEEFFKQLKIKAGLNPNYWSNNIKVYRFRTVEVEYEN